MHRTNHIAPLLGLVCLGLSLIEGRAMDKEYIDPLQTLSSFKGQKYEYTQGPQGIYTFYYSLPQSSRFEERTESGEVRGNYAYVAPEGDEFKFEYEAGKKGFLVESNALPTAPEDTEEVRKAKAEFFEAYEKALSLAALEGYGEREGVSIFAKKPDKEGGEGEGDEEGDEDEEEEDDEEEDDDDDEEDSDEDDESSEEDDEESSEEDDDESSEEDDDDESSEESSEESDEDDEEDEDEEEEEEDEDEEDDESIRKSLNVGQRLRPLRRKFSSYEIPNYLYKNRVDLPSRPRFTRNHRTRARNTRPRRIRITRKAAS